VYLKKENTHEIFVSNPVSPIDGGNRSLKPFTSRMC